MINQVKNRYGINKCRLNAYAKKNWDLIDNFQAFNITFNHKEKNHKANSLEATTPMFIPGDSKTPNSFKVSTLYQPIILDNEEALQVFENDELAQFFFASSEEEKKDLTVGIKN